MQYDYCAAYLELFNGRAGEGPGDRRPRTPNHPVDRWRNAFAAVTRQLDEIEGKGGKVVDPDDRDQQQGQLAATEPGVRVRRRRRRRAT